MDRSILGVIHLIRYRFLLFAGILPFFMGQAIAYNVLGVLSIKLAFFSFLGLVFVLIGVEAFNEYFDARIGTDRVFSLEHEDVPGKTLVIGCTGFLAAAAVMIFLTFKIGWPVMAFATAGGLFAAFYVMPPFKLAYRGLGEAAILLSYGPLMTLGSFYVQARSIDIRPFAASLVPALLILCVTVMNQIPDFYGDRIVGKRNITVRVGRERAINIVILSNLACAAYLIAGASTGMLPRLAWLICVPCILSIGKILSVRSRFEEPLVFIRGIRLAIIAYSSAVILLAVAYLI